MNIQEQIHGDVTVFKIDGRVDTAGAVDMDVTLHEAVAEDKFKMVLDLSELRYISSAGLRTLADILTRNQQNGGDLKLATVNPKILRILQIIGFDQFFTIYDTVDAAVESF